MNRRRFFELTFLGAGITSFMTISKDLFMSNLSKNNPQRMPVIFLGHGSPMNAVEKNKFTDALKTLGTQLIQPKAILVISAHWMTRGSFLTGMEQPKTIHDFYGFPQSLFEIQYPAPGQAQLAKQIQHNLESPKIGIDLNQWGLDHGTWSVLRHIYPQAQIPVIQLSLDMTQSAEYHLEFGKKLSQLRNEGVLILASGNIVHNLRQISWEENAPVVEWAQEFDIWVKAQLENRDFLKIAKEHLASRSGQLCVPTPDHFLPLLYILGASQSDDKISYPFEGFQNGSISMRCVRFG